MLSSRKGRVGFNGYHQRWEVYTPSPTRWFNRTNVTCILIVSAFTIYKLWGVFQ